MMKIAKQPLNGRTLACLDLVSNTAKIKYIWLANFLFFMGTSVLPRNFKTEKVQKAQIVLFNLKVLVCKVRFLSKEQLCTSKGNCIY